MNNKSRMGRLVYFINLVAIFIINILLLFLMTANEDSWPVVLLISLSLTVWAIVCHVRRWHDLGKSGWYVLLLLIPLANIFILLYLLFAPGVALEHIAKNGDITPVKDNQSQKIILITVASTIGVILLIGIGMVLYLKFYDVFEHKGGIRLILQVITDDAIIQELDKDAFRIIRELTSKEIDYDSARRGDGFFIKVSGIDSTKENDTHDFLTSTFGKSYKISRNRMEGNTDFTISFRESEISSVRESTVRQTMETIRRRMKEFGISKPRVRLPDVTNLENQDQIIVEFPAVDDPERFTSLLRETAQLKLCLVHEKYKDTFSSIQEAIDTIGKIPEDYQLLQYRGSDQGVAPEFILVRMDAIITGKDLKRARGSTDSNGAPAVSFFLTADSAKLFEIVTSEHISDRLAIVLDDMVYSAPTINSRIGAEGIITGNFTRLEAEDLALLLRSGALPASLKIIQENRVPPADD